MDIKKNVHRSIEAFDDRVEYSRFPVGGGARRKTAGGGTFVGSGKELSLHVSNPCSYYFLLCLHKPSAQIGCNHPSSSDQFQSSETPLQGFRDMAKGRSFNAHYCRHSFPPL